jgi:hypothetical protein
VVNLSSRGALLESSTRMRPGTCTELYLASRGGRRVLRGCVLRCAVAQLNPLRYRGAVIFDAPLSIVSTRLQRSG